MRPKRQYLHMKFNTEFITNIQAVDGQAGRQWIETLPSLLKDMEQKWQLQKIATLPNLTFNFVARVQRQDQAFLLKAAPPTRPLRPEVNWLKNYQKLTPQIHAFDEKQNVVLMEFCRPGTALREELPRQKDEAVTRQLAGVIRDLREHPVHDPSFRHLSDLIPDLRTLAGFVDSRLHAKTQSLWTDLTTDRSADRLLHGDLHHENILRRDSGWAVIDPHGYVGDPVAECGVMVYNPLGTLPRDGNLSAFLERRLRVLSEELGDDLQKIQAWCFCKTMLSAAWNIPDFPEQARQELHIATVLDGLRLDG